MKNIICYILLFLLGCSEYENTKYRKVTISETDSSLKRSICFVKGDKERVERIIRAIPDSLKDSLNWVNYLDRTKKVYCIENRLEYFGVYYQGDRAFHKGYCLEYGIGFLYDSTMSKCLIQSSLDLSNQEKLRAFFSFVNERGVGTEREKICSIYYNKEIDIYEPVYFNTLSAFGFKQQNVNNKALWVFKKINPFIIQKVLSSEDLCMKDPQVPHTYVYVMILYDKETKNLAEMVVRNQENHWECDKFEDSLTAVLLNKPFH